MLSDETSSDPVLVKLWNVSDPIEIGMLVVFTGLTVAEYMGRRYLSSTFDTTVQVRFDAVTICTICSLTDHVDIYYFPVYVSITASYLSILMSKDNTTENVHTRLRGR